MKLIMKDLLMQLLNPEMFHNPPCVNETPRKDNCPVLV